MEPDFRGVCPNCTQSDAATKLKKGASEYQDGSVRKVFGTVYKCDRCNYTIRFGTNQEEIKVYDGLSTQENTDFCPTCSGDTSSPTKQRLQRTVRQYADEKGNRVFGTVYSCPKCNYMIKESTRTELSVKYNESNAKSKPEIRNKEPTIEVVNEPWVDTYMEQHKEWIRNEQKRKWEGIEIRKRTEEKEKELERIKGIIEKKRNAIDPLNTKRPVYVENKPNNIVNKIVIKWSKIIGYGEIKQIIDAVLATSSKKKTHLLIAGAPGTSKTVFLKTIEESLKQQGLNVHYLDATTLSSSGVIEYLFSNDVKYALVDELDKLEKEHQKVFLNLLESGLLQETKHKKIRRKDMKDAIFICTANYIENLMRPLLTRFLNLNIPKYSKEQFYEIGCELLESQYGKTKDIAYYIVDSIWNIYTTTRNEEPNLRQCVQVSVLTDNDKTKIDPILQGITTYSKRYEE